MWRNASVRAGFRKLPQPLVFDFHPRMARPKLAIAHRVFFVRVLYLIRERCRPHQLRCPRRTGFPSSGTSEASCGIPALQCVGAG